jgi:REP element-mobilizing transposase RayT
LSADLITRILSPCRACDALAFPTASSFSRSNCCPDGVHLDGSEFALLAQSLAVVRGRRKFLLTAGVLLPDHWHVILFPPYPLTISDGMKSIKLSSTNLLGRHRGEHGELWQGRFPSLRSRAGFDRALRTVKEYAEAVEYIHLNPV